MVCGLSHLYFNGMFNMDEASTEAEYAVFDDMIGGFEFFKNYKAWLGCQYEFTLTDKYKRKTKFVWGKPSLWLANDDPLADPHVDHQWLLGNCDIVYIGQSFVSF